MATTTAAPPTPPADRGSPNGFVAVPRTLAERLAYLREDAARILARPVAFLAEEIAWAEDMLRAGTADREDAR
jgi:hypothetical protein